MAVGVDVGGGGVLVGDGVIGVGVAVRVNGVGVGVGVGSGVGTGVTVDVGLTCGGGDGVGTGVSVAVGEGSAVLVAGTDGRCCDGVVSAGCGSGAQAAATSALSMNRVKNGEAGHRFLMVFRESSAE